MSAETDKEFQRLRKHLNNSIQGPNTDKILETIAAGTSHLISNIEAINEQLYITTASERYLDQKMADRGVTRPDAIGLTDEIFRYLGVTTTTTKQITSLLSDILETIYGGDFTNATLNSTKVEPYNLTNGDTLILSFNKESPITIVFNSSEFTNIAAASATEVANAITKAITQQGRSGSAVFKDDGIGGYVQLLSQTRGPISSIEVLGGKTQNKIQFPELVPTSSALDTQWTVGSGDSGSMRLTWTGGTNPTLGKAKSGDYLNLYSTSFSANNRGTFTVKVVNNTGIVGQTYIEVINPAYNTETITQSVNEGFIIFRPFKSTITQKPMYAAVYHTNPRIVEIFMPATTKVVRRDRIGAAHIHLDETLSEDLGPYIYDTNKGYLIGQEECNLTLDIDPANSTIISVDNSSVIPDTYGNLIFGFGTAKEEGPVPYISRPSSNSLFINPAYKFKHIHASGTNISLVSQNSIFKPNLDGTDHAFYVTDVVSGRIYAESLIKSVVATGITLVINILYPNPIGLEKWDSETATPWKKVWSE